MARKSTRNAQGGGTIRQRPNGRWEARYTVGRDPGTGKQIQRSVYGSTQKEVRQKLAQITAAIDSGTYKEPCKMTLGQWLDIWQRDYLGGVKPATVTVYTGNIKNHIKPALGAVRLDQLHPHAVQGFVNGLDLSPASVRLAYKVLHQALEKAVDLGYIARNPATKCELPRLEQKEIHPLDDQQVGALLSAVEGGPLEYLVNVALFTGLRQSELLGLTWDAVDFQQGTINVNKQLSRAAHRASGLFISPKSGKGRIIAAAPSVMVALKHQRARQAEIQLRAGPLWDNPHGLVFTSKLGGPLEQWNVDQRFSAAVAAAGLEGVRFHDLRHTFAVASIRAGDDIKTVQGNLGHATAAFTLDRYGHFTERMKQDSAQRMESFIKGVLNL